MKFEFTVTIACAVEEVFAFFRDVDRHAGKKGTRVPVYDKLTPGPVRVGTRYREVVQMTPFTRWEVVTEVVCYEPERRLGYRFSGPGLEGELWYSFDQVENGTRVLQVQSLEPQGIWKPFGPVIGKMFAQVAGKRLEHIGALLKESPCAHID